MVDLHSKFATLDRLDPSELWSEIESRNPRPADPQTQGLRRAGIVVLALAIAVAGSLIIVRAFRPAVEPGDKPPSDVNLDPTSEVAAADAKIESEIRPINDQMISLMTHRDADGLTDAQVIQLRDLVHERHAICDSEVIYPSLPHSDFVTDVCESTLQGHGAV